MAGEQPFYEGMGIDEAVNALVGGSTATTEDSDVDEDELEGDTTSEEDSDEPEKDDEEDGDSEDDESDDEEPSDEDNSEEEDDDSEKYVFEVEDEETGDKIGITAEEAKSGYLRHRDYTKKTQALSKTQTEVTDLKQQMLEQKVQAAQMLEQLEMAGSKDMAEFVGVDWVKLQHDDPYSYEEMASKYDAAKRQYETVKQTRQQIVEAYTKEYQEQLAIYQKEQADKLAMLDPAFSPENGGEELTANLKKATMERYGFSEDELENLLDHRAMLVIRDAMEFHKLDKKLKSGKEKLDKVDKSIKPGAKSSKKVSTEQERKAASKKVAQSHSIEDAVDFVMASRRSK